MPSSQEIVGEHNQYHAGPENHDVEQAVYIEPPSSSTGGVLCEVKADRMTLTFLPLPACHLRWRWFRIACFALFLAHAVFAYCSGPNDPSEWYRALASFGCCGLVILYQILETLGNRRSAIRVMIEPTHITVISKSLGRDRHKVFPLDKSSQAAVDLQLLGNVDYCAITVETGNRAARFGRIETYNAAVRIIKRISEHLQQWQDPLPEHRLNMELPGDCPSGHAGECG